MAIPVSELPSFGANSTGTTSTIQMPFGHVAVWAAAAPPAPTPGRVVLYTLTEQDAKLIQARRKALGTVANVAEAGQTYPAVVVRVFDPSTTAANLRVLLDGWDDAWMTSRAEGEPGQPGRWAWPTR